MIKLTVITDIYIVLKNWWNTEILITERDKRNELSTKYNRGVNIIGVLYNGLCDTAIGLRITGVSILSTIVVAPAVIGMEKVTIIVMKLLRVVWNRAIKKMSLKIEKHEKIAMLAVSHLTLSIVSYQEHYQMTLFQMKNIH